MWGDRVRCCTRRLLEGRAWQARAQAEHQRARWAAGDDVALDDLVAHWREVVDLFEQYGERYEAARGRWRLAEVLLAAGDPSARRRARRARETAQALGAQPLLAALDHLAPRSGRAAPTTLTAREAEVLGLLAEGRSNGEIGRALFISTKTASVHVSNILAKLGAASRGEAVALARASGLLDALSAAGRPASARSRPVGRSARMPWVSATTSRLAPSMCAMTSASGRSVKYCT